MPLTRRDFLQRCLAGLLPAWFWPAHAAEQPAAPSLEETLRVYVDVLVPADETPSASALGVDRDLLQKGEEDLQYRRLYELGVDWLNEQARARGGRDFVSLDEKQRIGIVERAAAASMQETEGLFFEATRLEVLENYYTRPEAWQGLAGFRGPPQPVGYPEAHRPPAD